MHQIEGGIDIGERHGVGDQVVDVDLALHVPVDDFGHVGARFGAAERGAAPHPPGHQLKRPGRNFLASAGDADACPVKDEVIRVAERHELKVHIVSNGGIRPSRDPRIRTVIVPGGPDAADDWIAERIDAGDIAITADIPLAARCLDKGAQVLNHDGKPFTEAGIGMALAMRDLNRTLRESGEISGFNRSFTGKDRSRFLEALEYAVRTAQR